MPDAPARFIWAERKTMPRPWAKRANARRVERQPSCLSWLFSALLTKNNKKTEQMNQKAFLARLYKYRCVLGNARPNC